MTRLPVMALLLTLFLGMTARAQVNMIVTTDQTTYLQYEPVRLSVTLENNAGVQLDFGDDDIPNGNLEFTIRNGAGQIVEPRTGKRNVLAGMVLPPSGRKSTVLPLNSYFNIDDIGTYDLTVRLTHNKLNFDFQSKPVRFVVRQGTVLWSRDLGFPKPNGSIETRTASVIMMRDTQGHVCFYRVESQQLIYGTVRLCSMAAGSPPQFEVDSRNQVHILVASRPRLFSYYVFDLIATMHDMRNYSGQSSVPYLQKDPDIGRVMVLGGQIAREQSTLEPEDDFPVMEMK